MINNKGLSNEEVIINREKYGSNTFTKKKHDSFFKLLMEAFSDPIIKILLIALGIKTIFLIKDFDWYETVGIVLAILVASLISSISEYGSMKAFDKLTEESSKINTKVKRNGQVISIPINEVVVNDLVLLATGDKIPADGVIVSGNVSVDQSMMNGESKAFEIKTQFDTSRRLSKQIEDYKKVFNKCYIVVASEDIVYYEKLVEPTTGIIELYYDRGRIKINEYRKAVTNSELDSDILMGCLRTQEYKNIVLSNDGSLPIVSEFEMYDACKARIKHIPPKKLNELFLHEIKKRKSVTSRLHKVSKELRQICLSLNLSEKERIELTNQLCNPINCSDLCISHI